MVIDALAARYGGTAYAALQVSRRLADDPSVDEVILVAREPSLVSDGFRPRHGLKLIARPE